MKNLLDLFPDRSLTVKRAGMYTVDEFSEKIGLSHAQSYKLLSGKMKTGEVVRAKARDKGRIVYVYFHKDLKDTK